jgi:hypothetical protein
MTKESKALGSAYIDRHLDDSGETTFSELRAAFDRALQLCPQELVSATLKIAGHIVQLRIVGHALAAELLAPFGHLQVAVPNTAAPALKIDAWDQDATGITCAVVPAPPELTSIGIVVRSAEHQYAHLERSHSSMWLNGQDNHIIAWYLTASALTIEERSKPFYRLLYVWLARHDVHVVHAGLIARHGRGALLTGKGGAGKSTSTLRCLLAGFDWLGDDYVGLAASNEEPFRGFSLFSSCCIPHDSMSHFTGLQALISKPNYPDEEKSLLVLATAFRERVVAASPISLILLPRVVGRTTSVRRASPVEALMAIAPSSLLLMPTATTGAFKAIAQLVDRVPAYWLELGGPTEQLSGVIADLLDQATER